MIWVISALIFLCVSPIFNIDTQICLYISALLSPLYFNICYDFVLTHEFVVNNYPNFSCTLLLGSRYIYFHYIRAALIIIFYKLTFTCICENRPQFNLLFPSCLCNLWHIKYRLRIIPDMTMCCLLQTWLFRVTLLWCLYTLNRFYQSLYITQLTASFYFYLFYVHVLQLCLSL